MKKIIVQFLVVIILVISCQYERLEVPFDCIEVEIDLILINVQNADCQTSNGSFEVVAQGGVGEFVFMLNGTEQTSGFFSGLPSGTYVVDAYDANGCTGSLEVEIRNNDGVNITLDINDAGCGTQKGNIEISATGGEQPYTYSLDDKSGTNSEFSGLGVGTYEVKVSDNSGCEVTRTVSILSGVSYSSTIADIIRSNCAISGCHAGSISPDLRTLTNIQRSASRIKARTSAKTMPPSGALPQQQIDAIACWVDDGAMDN